MITLFILFTQLIFRNEKRKEGPLHETSKYKVKDQRQIQQQVLHNFQLLLEMQTRKYKPGDFPLQSRTLIVCK